MSEKAPSQHNVVVHVCNMSKLPSSQQETVILEVLRCAKKSNEVRSAKFYDVAPCKTSRKTLTCNHLTAGLHVAFHVAKNTSGGFVFCHALLLFKPLGFSCHAKT